MVYLCAVVRIKHKCLEPLAKDQDLEPLAQDQGLERLAKDQGLRLYTNYREELLHARSEI